MNGRLTISVVIPVLDSLPALKQTFPRIMKAVANYPHSELIVVDNGSEDGSYEWIREHADSGVHVSREEDVRVGEVRNIGARKAKGDVLCFVDADVLVSSRHLDRVRRALTKSEADAVGSAYQIPPNATWIQETWHSLHRIHKPGAVRTLPGGNLSVRTRAYWSVGGFDPTLVTGEDAKLCQQLRRNGYSIYQDPQIEGIHLGDPESIYELFQQQRWWGLGMFGTVNTSSIDKPVVMTLLHCLFIVTGLVYVGYMIDEVSLSLAVTGVSFLAIPGISVVYRWWQQGRIIRPITSLVLYEVFYVARIFALALIIINREEGWRS